jgi:D-alanyl-lipoteichoic acid acyltransferase DltB (MBOAT superfamily)
MNSVLNTVNRSPQGLTFNSFHFLVFCVLGVTVVRLLGGSRLKKWAILALNVYFLAQVVTGPAPFIFLAGLLLLTYLLGELRVRCPHRVPRSVLPAAVLLLWALLFAVKDPLFAVAANPFHYYQVLFIGFSYIVFRCIQYVMDVETFESRSLVTLVNFVVFFPTLFAGPLERYEVFQQFQDGPGAAEDTSVLWGLHRIASGLVKKYVLADNLMVFGFFSMPLDRPWPAGMLWIGVLSQLALLYLDFSGYCDIAAGLCRLMGLPLVENFNRPWLARDIQDFWNRWNISLSNFFRDYFFSPLSHLIIYHARRQYQFYLMTLIYFATMVLIALWHGLTAGFLAFGVLHGLALVAFQAGKRLRAAGWSWWPPAAPDSALGTALARGALYCFVSFSLVPGYCGVRAGWRIVSTMAGH